MNRKDKARLREMRKKGIDPFAPLPSDNRGREGQTTLFPGDAAKGIYGSNAAPSVEPGSNRTRKQT